MKTVTVHLDIRNGRFSGARLFGAVLLGIALLLGMGAPLAAFAQGSVLTITASSPSVYYGDGWPAITPTYSGTPPKKSPTCGIEDESGDTPPTGTYVTYCQGASDPIYSDIKYVNGTLTVNPDRLTITASSASLTVGQSIPAVTPSYSGFQNGDTSSSLTTAPTCSTTAGSTGSAGAAGSYPTSCAGAVDTNYNIHYVNGTVSVYPSTLIITASSASLYYGDGWPTITPTYNGPAPKIVPTCGIQGESTTKPAAGTYVTTCTGASDPNYSQIQYVNGTVTVGQSKLSITASSATISVGQAIPAVTPTYAGFLNGDTPSSLPTQPTCSTTAGSTGAPAAAGTYPTSCTGATDANYNIHYIAGTLSVYPSSLTITASSASIYYGDGWPTIKPTYDGPAPKTSPTCGIEGQTGAKPTAGTYVTFCQGAADPNYSQIQYVAGILTVGKSRLTITAGSTSTIYGQAVPAIAPTYTGFLNGDTVASLTTQATCSATGAATGSTPNAGSYVTACTGAADPNYNAYYVNGALTVAPAALIVRAINQTVEYGHSVPSLTWSANFVNGDSAASLAAQPTCVTNAMSSNSFDISPAGSYSISCSGATDPNYAITYTAGKLTVKPDGVTIRYTGPASVKRGKFVRLSAVLTASPGTLGLVKGQGLSGKMLTFIIGSGRDMRTCAGRTSSKGKASCVIKVAASTGLRTLLVRFAGDRRGSRDHYASGRVRPTLLVKPTV